MTERIFLGYPEEFKNICLIYPPKIKEMIDVRAPLFERILTLSQEEIEDDYNEKGLDLKNILTPFEYILNNAFHSKEFYDLMVQAFEFFIHEQVTPVYDQKKLIIGDITKINSVKELRVLTEKDYFDFQNKIREVLGRKKIEPPNPNEDPRVRAIKAKARYRDKVKAKKGMGLNFLTILSSICCMGIGLNPLNIGELSYAAALRLLDIYQLKEKYEIDIDSLLAGADSKKIKPKYWIENLDK